MLTVSPPSAMIRLTNDSSGLERIAEHHDVAGACVTNPIDQPVGEQSIPILEVGAMSRPRPARTAAQVPIQYGVRDCRSGGREPGEGRGS